jgi:heat shock protein HslJ/uncharacterized membrane protein
MKGYYRILLASAACVLASAAVDGEFYARGHEPGWGIRKADTGITFSAMDGRIVTVAPPRPDGGELYRSTTEAKPFVLLIADKVCTDTMSGTPYPKSVNVEIGAEKFAGCGGDPAGLLQREWTVGKIGGKPAAKEPKVSLHFGTAAQFSGSASCNRFFGPYTVGAEGLTISELGSSMMMCEQPFMDQESQFLGILRETRRFEIGQDGSLILHAKDGRSIVASRDRRNRIRVSGRVTRRRQISAFH